MTNLSLAPSALLTLVGLLLWVKTSRSLSVSFIHINDHHSHFDPNFFVMPPNSVPNGLSVPTPSGVKVYYGGASHVAGAIKELHNVAQQQGKKVMKIHAGDAMTGTVFYSIFGGEPDALFMNKVGFDAFVPGNHEFDDGDKNLANFIAMLECPVTSYNLIPGATSPLKNSSNLKKYIIKTFDDNQKVGFCGMIPKVKTEGASFPDPGTTFQDEVAATSACVADLRVEGVNKIVVMSHVGYEQDQERLALIEGVDVIIGGDSHTLLGVDAGGLGGPSSPYSYATIINKVCIVQAWEYQKIVGELTVTWDSDGNVLNCTGAAHMPYFPNNFTVIRSAADGGDYDLSKSEDIQLLDTFLSKQSNFLRSGPDQVVSDALKPFYDSLEQEMGKQIATALSNMCHNRGQGDQVPAKCSDIAIQTKLGGGVCLLVTQGFLYKVPNADFAIQNSGGCRTDINKGIFTTKNAYEVLPFSNTLATVILSGSLIHDVLEDAFENFLNKTIGGSTGSFPAAAGLRWSVNYTKPFGERVTDIEINSRLQSGVWKRIDYTTKYTVVTNSFVAQGKDGYLSFKLAENYTDTYVNYAQSLMDYSINKLYLDTPPIDQFSSQKIVFVNGEVVNAADVPSKSPTASPTTRTNTKSPTPSPFASPKTVRSSDHDFIWHKNQHGNEGFDFKLYVSSDAFKGKSNCFF